MARTLLQQVRARRKLRPSGRGFKPQFPKAIELAYFGLIMGMLRDARKRLNAELRPVLKELADRAAERRGDSVLDQADRRFLYQADAMDPGKRINKMLDRMSARFYKEWDPERLTGIARKIADRTSEAQKVGLVRQMKDALGIEPVLANKGIAQRIKDFTAENVSLIESIPQQFFDQVEQRVLNGVRTGARASDMAGEIQDRFVVAESRAKLIARDQVAKFYGDLNRVRQTTLGVGKYIWRTVNDERVRDRHEDLDGTVQSWDDPPVINPQGETGHPGEDIQCRCYADPVLEDLLELLE